MRWENEKRPGPGEDARQITMRTRRRVKRFTESSHRPVLVAASFPWGGS